MEAVTISQVSQSFGISARMLRYYEQTGLIQSFRRDGYAYRMYDVEAQSRLRQILILRKLRIPVKQIRTILQKQDAVAAIEVFRQNISELDEELTALSTIRNILSRLVDALQKSADIQLRHLLTQDDAVHAAIASLSLTSINFKEDKTLDNLPKAEEKLSKLRDMRIVYLPPATVAAAHYIGDDPENQAGGMIDRFVMETGLVKIKPDIRHYGFNHPNPVDETGYHGYEVWVTIPEDMEVPPPLVKKQFPGGLYAAHMIPFGDFDDWNLMLEWAFRNGKYEFAGSLEDQEHMCGLLEEYLNYVTRVYQSDADPADFQLDLLMPVKNKN